MKAYTFKRNKDFNFINNKSVSILSPLDRDSFALLPSGPSRETRNKETNSINKDTMPLDTPVKPEYDTERVLKSENDKRRNKSKDDNILSSTLSPSNIEYDTSTLLPSGANHNSPSLSFPCLTRESRKTAFRFADCGRSMVEMLGTLAIMGVLSIGGIMGYSYAIDKYHANQIVNDVNLRGIDLIAQASRGGDFSLAEWPTKTSSDLDIGLEIDEATNTTEGGIYVNGVEKCICEIIADDLLPEEVELVIDGESYVSGACGETNKMVFYYDAVAEALGETCNGPTVDGVCQPCEEGLKWSKKANACICASNTEFLYSGSCYSCPVGTTTADNGTECNCPSDYIITKHTVKQNVENVDYKGCAKCIMH